MKERELLDREVRGQLPELYANEELGLDAQALRRAGRSN
jgi:hypothetical protein